MKTDRFSDIIRRKLESIRPEFTEKDWTRMQSTLQQAAPPQPGSPVASQPFSGGIWSGSSWLLAAASISTVALIAFSIWQRSEINHLRETVGQLRQQSVPTQTAPASPAQESPALSKIDSQNRSQPASGPGSATEAGQVLPGNRDTASGTRYDAVPNSSRLEPTDERSIQKLGVPPKQRDAVASRAPVSVDGSRPQTNLNKTSKTTDYGVSSTPSITNKNGSSPSVATGKSTSPLAPSQRKEYAETQKQSSESSPANAVDTRNRITPDRAEYTRNNKTTDKANTPYRSQLANPTQRPTETGMTTQVANKGVVNPSEPSTFDRETSETYQLAASLPLSLPDRDWNSALVRRAKRMHLVQPMVSTPVASPAVANAKAPKSQPVARLAAGFRAGVGTDFNAHMWSAGVFSEMQLNKHWSLSVGLSKATYLGGLFITAIDFDNRTHRDFQKEFGPKLNPRPTPKDDDILNIDTRVQRFQIPLSLSYRIPLTRTLTLLPTVGTYLNLSSTEKIAFYFRDTPNGFDQANFSIDRPVALLTTFTMGTSLEWQSRHWGIQGSPLLSLPVNSDPDWQKGATIGARARVFYQF